MIQDILSSDITFAFLKWLFLLTIWLFLAFGLHRDNKKIRKFHDSSISIAMLQILHRRNLHIYGLVSMLLIILLTNDIKREMQPAQAIAQAPLIEKPAVSAPAAVSPAVKTVDTPQFSVPQSSKIPFSEITEFNETDSKQQAYTDFLKQRYETWIITYYYLQKCGKVNASDLEIIMASMRKALQSTHADPSVEGNIVIAANGSYKEMYSDIPCDEAHISSTKSGYDSSMQQIKDTAPALAPSQQFPAPQATQNLKQP